MSEVENFKLTSSDKWRVFAWFLGLPVIFVLWPSPIVVLLFVPAVVATVYFGRRRDRS